MIAIEDSSWLREALKKFLNKGGSKIPKYFQKCYETYDIII